MKKQNIEVEGGEILIMSKEGHYAVIPAKHRQEIMDMIKDGCDDCINNYIQALPKDSDYAEDGSLYSEYLTPDSPTKKHPLDPNPDGSLPSYFKGSKENPIKLDEYIVTAKAPEWVRYRNEYIKNNPFNIDEYVENRFNNPVGREKIEKIDQEGWRKKLKQEGLEKRYNSAMDYVGEQLVKNKPQGKLSRAEWLNQMTDKEEEIIKRNPKYQSSLWTDTKRGLTSLIELNPLQAFQNILNSSDYTNREKQEMLKDYVDHPVMSKLGNAAKILNPLTVPSKMVQSAYKDDYSFSDALKGKKNNAGIVEDIVTDPLNLVGVGLAGKLSKADKVIDATKAGSKVLNKEGKLHKLTELELLTEKEIAQKRANRLLEQKNKWVGQDDKVLEGQLKNAGKNHENNLTAQEFNIKYNSSKSSSNIGINKEGKTFIFKDAPLTELNKKRVAAHEVGHYYRNTLEEGLEWDKYFDFTGTPFKEKKYLRGKGLTGNGSVKGDELRERAAQLKDFIAVKNNIPLDKDFVITPSQFDDALKNYVKETGLDNNMETFIKAIKDKKGLLKEINKRALSIAPAALYLQSQNQNKTEQ